MALSPSWAPQDLNRPGFLQLLESSELFSGRVPADVKAEGGSLGASFLVGRMPGSGRWQEKMCGGGRGGASTVDATLKQGVIACRADLHLWPRSHEVWEKAPFYAKLPLEPCVRFWGNAQALEKPDKDICLGCIKVWAPARAPGNHHLEANGRKEERPSGDIKGGG